MLQTCSFDRRGWVGCGQAMLFLFAFTGAFGGYTAGRLFRMFRGTRWKANGGPRPSKPRLCRPAPPSPVHPWEACLGGGTEMAM